MGWGVGRIMWGVATPPPADCGWTEPFTDLGDPITTTGNTYTLGTGVPSSADLFDMYDETGVAYGVPNDDGSAHSPTPADTTVYGLARGIPDCDPQNAYTVNCLVGAGTAAAFVRFGLAFPDGPATFPALEWLVSSVTSVPRWDGGTLAPAVGGGTNIYSIRYDVSGAVTMTRGNSLVVYDGPIAQTGPPSGVFLTVASSNRAWSLSLTAT